MASAAAPIDRTISVSRSGSASTARRPAKVLYQAAIRSDPGAAPSRASIASRGPGGCPRGGASPPGGGSHVAGGQQRFATRQLEVGTDLAAFLGDVEHL